MSQFAIITGGANGIGQAVCYRFAASGILVGIVDVERDGAEGVKTEIISKGGQAEVYCADVTDPGQVRGVVQGFYQLHGRIDILANIAGGTAYLKRIEELGWSEWNEEIDINLKGTFLFCREVAPFMIRRGMGRIVNTASNYGATGCALRTPYSAAKAAIVGFSRSLALELAPYGVLVNVVAPGPTDTPRVLLKATPEARQRWRQEIPLGRTAQPEDIAEGFYFLVSPESADITGQTIHMNGGLVMP